MLTGGCSCGAIRFRLEDTPYDTGWCHCRICQHVSGAGGLVFTTVSRPAFVVERGADRLGRFKSTPFGERGFCMDCGAPLTIHVSHQSDEIDIAAGALDHPQAVTPTFHIYAGEAPPWMPVDDGLPCFDALRPTTRGLEEGQTEAG